MFKPCAVIPVYNHEQTVAAVVENVLAHHLPCILVDDGSGARCAQELDRLAAAVPEKITLLRHPANRGKGSAVLTGARRAADAGYSHALQIDADGQHRAADIPRFLTQAAARPQALIIGCPEYDLSAPALRLWARSLTHLWVSINTMSRRIQDSMCGFRVYPLASLLELDRRRKLGARMDFDIEVAVRLYWMRIEIINVPTLVIYPRNAVSHFRMWSDTLLISYAHATLFFGMLLRLPNLLARQWSAL
jgi:glycosyltransferase involved in cell wall biosynthesis